MDTTEVDSIGGKDDSTCSNDSGRAYGRDIASIGGSSNIILLVVTSWYHRKIL